MKVKEHSAQVHCTIADTDLRFTRNKGYDIVNIFSIHLRLDGKSQHAIQCAIIIPPFKKT